MVRCRQKLAHTLPPLASFKGQHACMKVWCGSGYREEQSGHCQLGANAVDVDEAKP